jgi:hypothetical protein
MSDHILERAKAYAVLVGLIVTAVLGSVPADSKVHAFLVALGGLATVVATYTVPNKPKAKV